MSRDKRATYEYLRARFRSGATVKRTRITKEFSYDDFASMYGTSALPIFFIRESGDLSIYSIDDNPAPKAGQVLVAVVDEADSPAES